VHAEYVFSVKEMRRLLKTAADQDIIAIKIRFEPDKRAGRRRIFRSLITAEVEPLQKEHTEENGLHQMRLHNFQPAAKTIEGCPRPPSCDSLI
jgi:hypothetical protein